MGDRGKGGGAGGRLGGNPDYGNIQQAHIGDADAPELVPRSPSAALKQNEAPP
jgi:hypothetical protein